MFGTGRGSLPWSNGFLGVFALRAGFRPKIRITRATRFRLIPIAQATRGAPYPGFSRITTSMAWRSAPFFPGRFGR